MCEKKRLKQKLVNFAYSSCNYIYYQNSSSFIAAIGVTKSRVKVHDDSLRKKGLQWLSVRISMTFSTNWRLTICTDEVNFQNFIVQIKIFSLGKWRL